MLKTPWSVFLVKSGVMIGPICCGQQRNFKKMNNRREISSLPLRPSHVQLLLRHGFRTVNDLKGIVVKCAHIVVFECFECSPFFQQPSDLQSWRQNLTFHHSKQKKSSTNQESVFHSHFCYYDSVHIFCSS
jgi:hypothetical protein